MNLKLKLLILSDVMIVSGFGLIAPIFAIFIEGSLIGGTLVSAGLATTIFLVVKSSAQLPLSKFVDKERHKTRLLVLGTFLIILVPFIYVFAKHVYVIFVAQAVYGLGTAFAYPAWFSLFTTYLDKRHKGFEYAVYSTSVGLGTALAAFFGAKVADVFGFKALFFVVGIIAFIGFLILIFLDHLEDGDLKNAERGRKKRERRKTMKR